MRLRSSVRFALLALVASVVGCTPTTATAPRAAAPNPSPEVLRVEPMQAAIARDRASAAFRTLFANATPTSSSVDAVPSAGSVPPDQIALRQSVHAAHAMPNVTLPVSVLGGAR